MNTDILCRINEKYESMSKGNKKISDYVKENLYKLPFLKISELSKEVGVSDASITRFTKFLGFRGYSDFQYASAEIVKKDLTPMKEVKQSIEADILEDSVLKANIENNLNVIKNLLTEELIINYDKAIDLLSSARNIYIVSCRSSYTVGYYLHFLLKGFMDNVYMINSGNEDSSNTLAHVKKGDVLLAISYSQYTKFTYNIVNFFHEEGLDVISITDSYSSPIALKSESVLLAKNPNEGYSFVTAMIISNSIVTSLGKIDKKKTLDILDKQLNIAIKHNVYL